MTQQLIKLMKRVGPPALFLYCGVGMGIGFDPKKKYEEIVELAAKNCGFGVYERVIRLKGDNTKIVVKIDSPDGISHDDCHRYSNELSRLLDEDGSLPNYMLEISSPGLDRKLVTREDFIRFTGSPVKVIYESESGGRAVKGPLLSADEKGITVDVTEEKRTITIPFHSIKGANLDY